MAELYDAMKNVAKTVVENSELCDIVIGQVVSISPLEVKISDRISLDSDQLLLTQAVTQKTVNCAHIHKSDDPTGLPTPIIVIEGLKAGDEVLLLKVQKGQRYVILSKVVGT